MTLAAYSPARPVRGSTPHVFSVVIGIARGGRSLVTRLAMYVIGRWRRQRAMAALNALDNRQLKDIGISRADIPYVVVARRYRRR